MVLSLGPTNGETLGTEEGIILSSSDVEVLGTTLSAQMESHLDYSLSDFLQPPRLPCFPFIFLLSAVLSIELVSASLSTFSLL